MERYTGESIETATLAASKELGVDKEKLTINVIQQPHHGFLGIGRRDAIIEAAAPVPAKEEKKEKPVAKAFVKSRQSSFYAPKDKEQPSQEEIDPAEMKRRHAQNLKQVEAAGRQLVTYLEDVFAQLGIKVVGEIKGVRSHEIKIDLQSDQSGKIIGHHGRRINAMEQLSQVFMNYHHGEKTMVILDTANYRKRREESLHQLAERSATEVLASGKAVFLDPMPARERKQLHRELEGNSHVKTYSHGREPYRSIVIAPKN